MARTVKLKLPNTVGVPFKVGLSALLGKPLADAVFGLWVLVFVLWIGINVWRWAQRGDEA